MFVVLVTIPVVGWSLADPSPYFWVTQEGGEEKRFVLHGGPECICIAPWPRAQKSFWGQKSKHILPVG